MPMWICSPRQKEGLWSKSFKRVLADRLEGKGIGMEISRVMGGYGNVNWVCNADAVVAKTSWSMLFHRILSGDDMGYVPWS